MEPATTFGRVQRSQSEEMRRGKVLAVNWSDIQEMLGEAPERNHMCALCDPSSGFPPSPINAMDLPERVIQTIIAAAGVSYIADVPTSGMLPIQTRYFACQKPAVGPWLQTPKPF